jgi:hypothetical protein
VLAVRGQYPCRLFAVTADRPVLRLRRINLGGDLGGPKRALEQDGEKKPAEGDARKNLSN